MKKTTLLAAFALGTGVLLGQSQRFVLIEGFTQASCPPCASYNPGFHTLMTANTTKVMGMHYQVSWPGTDPMNAQNKAEVASRVSYYGIQGVPDEAMDGKTTSNASQSSINTEYAVASPFNIKLDYWFNAANDSVFISCDVTCTQATTMTTPKLRVAMIEKTITFTSAPGSNGEKKFYNVMRKMYASPSTANNSGGTTLSTAWTVGQTKSFLFKDKIPTYIYQKSEIATVAWIQDDANKNVKQSVYSATPNNVTGVAESVTYPSLNIFPNPSNGIFTAAFETEATDNYIVKITNALGQIVYEETLNNFSGSYSREINIASFGKGVYLLSISGSKNEDVEKVLTY